PEGAAAPASSPPAEPAAAPAPASPPTWSLADVARWVGLAYLGLAALLAGRWLLGQVLLGRLLRSARPAPAAAAPPFLSMARSPPAPRLLVSSRLRVPLSCGLLRPTVVVPAALCDDPRALRWVFAHELTHLQRRDVWTCVLFALGEVVYFYLPWFWWLRRQ